MRKQSHKKTLFPDRTPLPWERFHAAGGAYPCLGPARRAITTDQPTPSVRNMRKTSLASEWSPQMDAVSVEIRAYGELEVRRVAGRHRHLEEATR